MGGSALNSTASGGDIALAGSGEKATGEFFFFGFAALDSWDGKELGIDTSIPVEDGHYFGFSSSAGLMCGVAFLPEELASAEEGLRVLEFPTDDRVPLVKFEREITVGADPFGVVRVHDSFRSGTDRNVFFEFGAATADDTWLNI